MQQTPGDVDAAGVDELVLHLQLTAGYGDVAFVADRSAADIGVAAIGHAERSLVVERRDADAELRAFQAGHAGIDRSLIDELVATIAVIGDEIDTVAGLLQQQIRAQRQHRRAAAVVQVEVIPRPGRRCATDIDGRVVQRLRAVHEQMVVVTGNQHSARSAAIGSRQRRAVGQMQVGVALHAEVQHAFIRHAAQNVPETAIGLETVALVLNHAIEDRAAVQQQRAQGRAGADNQRAASVVQHVVDLDRTAVVVQRQQIGRCHRAAEGDGAVRADGDLAAAGHAAIQLQQPAGDVDAAGVDERFLHLQLAAGDADDAFVGERSATDRGVDTVTDDNRSLVVEPWGAYLELRAAKTRRTGIDGAQVDDLIARVAVVGGEIRIVAGLLQQQVRPQGQHRPAVTVEKIEVVPIPVPTCGGRSADVDRRVIQRLRAIHQQVVVAAGDQHGARTAAANSRQRRSVLQVQIGTPLPAEVECALIGHAVQHIPETAVGLEAAAVVQHHAADHRAAAQHQAVVGALRRVERAGGVVDRAVQGDRAAGALDVAQAGVGHIAAQRQRAAGDADQPGIGPGATVAEPDGAVDPGDQSVIGEVLAQIDGCVDRADRPARRVDPGLRAAVAVADIQGAAVDRLGNGVVGEAARIDEQRRAVDVGVDRAVIRQVYGAGAIGIVGDAAVALHHHAGVDRGRRRLHHRAAEREVAEGGGCPGTTGGHVRLIVVQADPAVGVGGVDQGGQQHRLAVERAIGVDIGGVGIAHHRDGDRVAAARREDIRNDIRSVPGYGPIRRGAGVAASRTLAISPAAEHQHDTVMQHDPAVAEVVDRDRQAEIAQIVRQEAFSTGIVVRHLSVIFNAVGGPIAALIAPQRRGRSEAVGEGDRAG